MWDNLKSWTVLISLKVLFQDKNRGKPIGGKISKKDLVKGKPAGGIREGKNPIRKEGGMRKRDPKKRKKGEQKKKKEMSGEIFLISESHHRGKSE